MMFKYALSLYLYNKKIIATVWYSKLVGFQMILAAPIFFINAVKIREIILIGWFVLNNRLDGNIRVVRRDFLDNKFVFPCNKGTPPPSCQQNSLRVVYH